MSSDSLPNNIRVPDDFIAYLPELVCPPNPDDHAQVVYYPAALRRAYANGDYDTIKATEKRTAEDLTPNWGAIKANGKNAFATVTNPSDGVRYQMCASQHGWIWAYTYKSTSNIDGKDVEQMWAQVGSYSSNGSVLGLSNTKWQQDWGNLAVEVISQVMASVVSAFIASRMAGMTFSGAVARAVATVLAEGVATEAFAATLSTILGGIIAGIVLTVLLWLLIHVIWRDYTLIMDIHNWTTDDYVIADWYSDNAAVGEGKSWRQQDLPGISGTVIMPDGTKVPSADTISRFDRYVYQNVQKLFEGLGVAVKIVKKSDPHSGFMVKYGLWRFSDNQMGAQNNLGTSLRDFYKSDWAEKGTFKLDEPFDKTRITLTTDALSGGQDNIYRFHVHIGVHD